MELLSKLGIDWKLLIAQIVNFAILVGVLSYFVYKPLLTLLDARREKIRKAMEHADNVEKQRKELEAFRTEQLRKIDQEAGALLEKARQQAEKMHSEILTSAKKETDQMLDRGRKQLESERTTVMHELQGTLATIIMQLTQKIIEREFSSADQRRILTALEKEIPNVVR